MTLILTINYSSQPLFKTVAQSLIEAMEAGRLQAGAALPPTRELADYLNISRDTVVKAYEDLAGRGYVQADRTRGTLVKARTIEILLPTGPPADVSANSGRLSEYGERLLKQTSIYPGAAHLGALNFGAPPAQFLPLRRWGEFMKKHSQSSHLRYEPDDLGRGELRQALAGFLRRSRAIQCCAEEIAVFSQSQNALNLLVRLLANPGDAILVEEPGFGGIRNIAEGHGLSLVPIAVDEEGIDINQSDLDSAKIRLIYVTPAHHDPTGCTMSLARRRALLCFARRHNAWIIEDDADSNFNYASKPLPALKALEPEGNIIYLSTFWKLLYPLSAVGFCLMPRSLHTVLSRAKALVEPYSNSLEQIALAEMLNDGYLERHTRKVQKQFSARRRAFIVAMKKNFGSLVDLPKESGAMQYLVRFQGELASIEAEEVIAEAGRSAGLRLMSSAYAYMTGALAGEFIFDFAGMDESTLTKTIDSFAGLVKSMRTALPKLIVEQQTTGEAGSILSNSIGLGQDWDSPAPIVAGSDS